jgi:hypothetical protein
MMRGALGAGLRLWASVCLALYVAFWLQLDNGFCAGTSAVTTIGVVSALRVDRQARVAKCRHGNAAVHCGRGTRASPYAPAALYERA